MNLQELRTVAESLGLQSPKKISRASMIDRILSQEPIRIAEKLSVPGFSVDQIRDAVLEMRYEAALSTQLGRRGILATLVTFALGCLSGYGVSWHFWKNPPPPPPDALKIETLDNLQTLSLKTLTSDSDYKFLVDVEEEPSNFPNPYKDLGDKITRDLPHFSSIHLADLRRAQSGVKEPFKSYTKIYELFASLETEEWITTRMIQRGWETYARRGTPDVRGIPAFRIQMEQLLADYVRTYGIVTELLKEIGVHQVPELPKNLFFMERMAARKQTSQDMH